MNAITREKSKLGFVGVGYMGRPIARRLLESGFMLSAYDRHRNKAEQLIPYGGAVAESVAELSSSCDVLLSCLATDEAVLNIYQGSRRRVCQCASRVAGHRPEHRESEDLAGTLETRLRAWSSCPRRDHVG